MNENFEKYIEGLSPELQEKARWCRTSSELMELAADNDVELPLDALAGVAGGGCGGEQRNYYHINCGGIARSLGDDGYVCQKCNEMLSFNDVEVR